MRLPVTIALATIAAFSSGARAQNPVGQIFASDATVKGSVELASGGAKVMSGSTVAAGDATAILKLDRGGEIKVCPHTTMSVATSQSGRDLMLGINSGGLETHYTVSATADAIVTPDFRILLAGPGRFDFAIETGKSGDTCVRALPGNSSSLIVSELMGDATYQVKPAERLLFRNGKLADPDHGAADCGCVSAPPVLRAEATPPPKPVRAPAPNPPYPAPKPADAMPVHVEVDAPFVYRAEEDAGPSPLAGAVTLHVVKNPPNFLVMAPQPTRTNVPQPVVDAALNKKGKQGGFFGHIKGFFAGIFH
jgi:hypothetical protein